MDKWGINDLYRNRNYRICMGIDMISLGVVLEEMVKSGDLSEKKAEHFQSIASSLLHIIRLENNKLVEGSDVR